MALLRPSSSLACCIVLTASFALADGFEADFEDATLRVDLYQLGNATTEQVVLDRLVRQGEWAGPTRNLDHLANTGRYLVRAVDADDGTLIFSGAFDSLFGEYRSTEPAARGITRVVHETVLLPFPRRPIRLTVSSRGATGDDDQLLLESAIDPRAVEIAVEPPATGATVIEHHVSGDPHTSLDIAFIGEGYTGDELDLFRSDLARFAELLLAQEPYASERASISIRGVVVPSRDSGCDEPTRGRWRDTAVGTSFNALGSPRYLLTEANRGLRDIAANVPYDTLVIMVNHDRYGGGGIANRYCTFTAHGAFAGYLLLHELGHSLGGLADEYYTSSTAYTDFYPRGVEPAEANITALADPESLKWAELATPGVELPTPWDKDRFDAEDLAYQAERQEIDDAIARAARADALEVEQDVLEAAAERHALRRVAAVKEFMTASGLDGTLGAFEGAGYASQGLYRPAVDCLMFSRGVKPLCPVCRAAVAETIARITGR